MSKKWIGEIVNVLYEDGVKQAVMFQNGHIEIFKLKKATKQDTAEIFEVDIVDPNLKK